MIVPNFSSGIWSQKLWRGVGDIDDCVVLAVIRAIAAVAGWVALPSAGSFREAAGNPDDPNAPDGLTQGQAMFAIKKLWPELAPFVKASPGTGTWADLMAGLKAGRPAYCSVFGPGFATRDGKPVRHAITVYWTGMELREINPIKVPHAYPTPITEAELKQGMADYPESGFWYVLFPTVEEAFKTHPLYRTQDASEQQLAAARSAGFTAGKTKAVAAASAVTEA